MKQYLSPREQKQFDELLANFPLLPAVDAALREQGGKLYLVGGAVRNIIMGLPITDVDVEMHGISSDDAHALLRRFGYVELVGKSFGVFKLAQVSIDWALPRTDSVGRKPEVTVDSAMPIEDALRRRDLTMNAMALEVATGTLVDPFGGRDDITQKRLRAVDATLFVQDPLRFYRVMQSIGRFEMQPDAELNRICTEINLAGLSRERICSEFEKLCMLSRAPSQGIRWLRILGRLAEILPEVAALVGVEQELDWHPEGDVFEHTMQALDAAAQQIYPDEISRRYVIYAALCHDLGKATTTRLIDGRLRSFGHEQAGVEPTKALMQRITLEQKLQQVVALLVRHHMAPVQLVKNNAKPAAYKRLAAQLAPRTNLEALALLASADKRGRNPDGSMQPFPLHFVCDGQVAKPLPDVDAFRERAEAAGVLYAPEQPLLRGADLEGLIPPGPEWGKLLDHAYELQIEQGITEKQELLKRILK